MEAPPKGFIESAMCAASASMCSKSQRGVALWDPSTGVLVSVGCNYRPDLYGQCSGSEICRSWCNRLCIHAEADALLDAAPQRGLHMLHVKSVKGTLAPSGGPSCWQCSRLILAFGIETMWLFHKDGWMGYPAEQFHRITLANTACESLDLRKI